MAILTDQFVVSRNDKDAKYKVTLDKDELYFTGIKGFKVNWCDLVGVQVVPPVDQSFTHYNIVFFHYPFVKKTIGKSKRKREKIYIQVDGPSRKDNREKAEKWRLEIKITKMGLYGTSFGSMPKNRYLVLVNPAGGKGSALKIANEKLLPIMGEADIEHNLITTEYEGHGLEIVRDSNLAEYNGIAIVSGDGLFHEVLNGLMQREDRAEILKKISLIPIPAGSGNSLAASIIYSSTGIHNDEDLLLNMVVLMATGYPTKATICKIEQQGVHDKYSFLLQMWGMMADIDFESEKYRKPFGGQRFLISAIKQIATLKQYEGTVQIMPEGSKDWITINGPITNVLATSVSHFNFDALLRTSRDIQEVDEEGNPLITVHVFTGTSKVKTTEYLLNLQETSKIDKLEQDIPDLKVYRATKLKFMPASSKIKSLLDIDGERAPYAQMTIETSPISIQIIAGERLYDSVD